jgi:hypothetical protein
LIVAGAASIDALTKAFADLRIALESEDAEAIFEASRKVRQATSQVRAEGAWHIDADLRAKLSTLMPMIESARVRVNVASDTVRQRITLLADHGGSEARVTYSR